MKHFLKEVTSITLKDTASQELQPTACVEPKAHSSWPGAQDRKPASPGGEMSSRDFLHVCSY